MAAVSSDSATSNVPASPQAAAALSAQAIHDRGPPWRLSRAPQRKRPEPRPPPCSPGDIARTAVTLAGKVTSRLSAPFPQTLPRAAPASPRVADATATSEEFLRVLPRELQRHPRPPLGSAFHASKFHRFQAPSRRLLEVLQVLPASPFTVDANSSPEARHYAGSHVNYRRCHNQQPTLAQHPSPARPFSTLQQAMSALDTFTGRQTSTETVRGRPCRLSCGPAAFCTAETATAYAPVNIFGVAAYGGRLSGPFRLS